MLKSMQWMSVGERVGACSEHIQTLARIQFCENVCYLCHAAHEFIIATSVACIDKAHMVTNLLLKFELEQQSAVCVCVYVDAFAELCNFSELIHLPRSLLKVDYNQKP